MYLWINMISVIEINTLLFMGAASPVINNKASCYFMRKQRAFEILFT